MKTDLSRYDNSWYKPGPGAKRATWYLVDWLFFKSPFPLSGIKVRLLRAFGATIGEGVVIKPFASVKYPWFLTIGNHTWIGEKVWIDNLTDVHIGSHVCLSQGAFLLTGNHNFKLETFDLMVGPIVLEDGVWIGARAIVCPGVTCRSHSILSVASVASKDLEPYGVYTGNPAMKVRERIKEPGQVAIGNASTGNP